MTRWQGWLVSLSAALLAIVLAGPPLYSAVSATIQHNEDTVAVSGALGTAMLCVRNDGTAALTTSNNFYANCITDANNRQWVRPAWLTSIGGSLEDTTNVALRVSPVTVVTTQGKTMQTAEWSWTSTGASAFKIVQVTSSQKIRVSGATFVCDAVGGVRLGFVSGSALPGVTNALDGAQGMILSAAGLAAGTPVSMPFAGAVEGANDDDLMVTTTGTGTCRLAVQYEKI